MIIAILAGSYGLQRLLGDDNFKTLVKRLVAVLIILSFLGVISAGLIILFSPNSAIREFTWTGGNFKLSVKALIDRLSFADLLLVSALVLLTTVLLIKINLSSTRKIAAIVVVNLIINTWLTLPFTGLGMKTKRQIHYDMTQAPRGIFPQELQPLNKTTFIDSSLRSEFIMLGSYSKKIGYPKEEQYPIELKNTQKFFNDSSLFLFIIQQSYIFLSSDTTETSETNFDSTSIKIRQFAPGYLHIGVNNIKYRFITFLQNDYPYWQTLINGKIAKHYTGFKTFISIPIQPGHNEVEFVFSPTPVKRSIIVNCGILLLGLISLLSRRLRDSLLVT
ncbi:MAG: hypothetical protein E6H10_02910 [Bacteroidetes bacterium]|nr:MAG: hypothetical protein E6H10_02910 [Bacteroidota bacterium]